MECSPSDGKMTEGDKTIISGILSFTYNSCQHLGVFLDSYSLSEFFDHWPATAQKRCELLRQTSP